MASRRKAPARRGKAQAGGIQNPYVRFQKLARPELEPETTTLWTYPHGQYGDGRQKQGDPRFVGSTPSWVIWQYLSRWTSPGQKVLDPFCGSGTSLDVCRDLEREGIGFDVAPTRADIQEADARVLPLADDAVDHAFLDPPYADNLTYSDDERCLGRLSAEGGSWARAMDAVFLELHRVVRPGGFIAAYVQDTMREKTGAKTGAKKSGAKKSGAFRFFALGAALAEIGQNRFWLHEHIVVVRGHQKLGDAREQKKAETGALMRGFNHLLIFQIRPGKKPSAVRSEKKPAIGQNAPRGDFGGQALAVETSKRTQTTKRSQTTRTNKTTKTTRTKSPDRLRGEKATAKRGPAAKGPQKRARAGVDKTPAANKAPAAAEKRPAKGRPVQGRRKGPPSGPRKGPPGSNPGGRRKR